MQNGEQQYYNGTVIVSFENREMRSRFEEQFTKYSPKDQYETLNSLLAATYRDITKPNENKKTIQNFTVKRAAHPDEIMWNNIGASYVKGFMWSVLNFVLIFGVTAITFVLVAVIKSEQKKLDATDKFGYRSLSVAIAGVVVFNNYVIQFLVPIFTEFQRESHTGSMLVASSFKVIFVVRADAGHVLEHVSPDRWRPLLHRRQASRDLLQRRSCI
jgi:hypothetical protein